ncbi:MAG: hypothetical protein K5984_04840 [Bacteroidales bacterium]|nr:hypothetical protein [Bacteroidales bacterium]
MAEEKKIRKHPVLRGILFAVAGVWAVALVAMQVVLNSKVLTKIVNDIAAEYVEGDIAFGEIKASVIKSFPNLNVSLTDFSITYPHDRFAAFDSTGVRSFHRRAGRGAEADTLASVNNVSISLNYMALAFGKIRVPELTIQKPRFYLHQYDSTTANWNMFVTGEEEEEDTTDTGFTLPNISLGEIVLEGKPRVIYTNISDTLFAAVLMKRFDFDGRLATRGMKSNKINLELDSLFVAGRLPADTLALGLDRLKIEEHRNHMDVNARAKAFLATNGFGRMMIPINMDGELSFPKSRAVSLREFKADIATLEILGEADVELKKNTTKVKADFKVEETKLADLLDFLSKNFPVAKDIKTNAVLSAGFNCDGEFDSASGSVPPLSAYIRIPSSSLGYVNVPEKGTIALDITATGNQEDLQATFNEVSMNFAGIDLAFSGKLTDILEDDPLIALKGNGNIDLAKAAKLADPEMGLEASGMMKMNIGGSARISQLDPYNFSGSDLNIQIAGDSLRIHEAVDTVDALVINPLLSLAPSKGETAAKFTLDSLNARYGSAITVAGSKILFKGVNGQEALNLAGMVHPLIGRVNIGALRMVADSAFIGIRQSGGEFKMTRKPSGQYYKPEMNIKARLGRFFYRESVNRIGLKNLDFKTDIVINTYENVQKRKHFMDSLERAYPGVPKDSIFARLHRQRMKGRPVPDFIKEKDFRKSDIDIRLDRETGKYLMDWDIKGSLDLERGIVITPYFPLRNRLLDVHGTFTNDKIDLSNFTFSPGESSINASGSLRGLRRALTRGGLLFLRLKVGSKHINANELLAAAEAGGKFQPEANDALSSMSDDEYLAQVATDTLAVSDSAQMSLIVVPANLIMKIDVDLDSIRYNNLNVECLSGKIVSKERCLQLTDAKAITNMGNLGLEAFYSTRTKQDLKAGFNLNMSDISADQVIALFPAVDSLMPMLTAFKGMLNCELAATTQIDTNMNLIMPSLNGVMKINGKNLELEQTGAVKTLARILMFKNKQTGKIDDMEVNGVIHDNMLEVFPFILKIDRYTLALNGLQNLEDDFKYHISVIKSPVPIRFGINIFGTPDKWKWRIGKARFKNTKIPVFVSEIDTMQVNLVKSIHDVFDRGVNNAFQNNRNFSSIEQRKAELNFSTASQGDSLSQADQKQLDSLNYAFEHPEEAKAAAKAKAKAEAEAKAAAEAAAAAEAKPLTKKELRQQRRQERKQNRIARKEEKKNNEATKSEE